MNRKRRTYTLIDSIARWLGVRDGNAAIPLGILLVAGVAGMFAGSFVLGAWPGIPVGAFGASALLALGAPIVRR